MLQSHYYFRQEFPSCQRPVAWPSLRLQFNIALMLYNTTLGEIKSTKSQFATVLCSVIICSVRDGSLFIYTSLFIII